MATLTDTNAHREIFQKLLGKRIDRMRVLPVGVRDLPLLPPASGEIVVQYAGTYIPFHGVEVILRAAKMLPELRFELIGKGQTYPAAIKRGGELKLKNAHFVNGYFSKDELMGMQARSTIMLGVFADAPKTRYVVPTKIYEALALGRPLVTAESPALREFFTPGEHLITVPPADPTALADAILDLVNSPLKQERLRLVGRSRIEAEFLPEHIGAHLKAIIERGV
jgi:glycosyltransferase involved in cell wall biosynthesis